MAEIGVVPGGGLPFGGIYKVQAPFTDQVTASLLTQQADRRKAVQETTQQTDQLMNKELANVRSVDMPDVVDAYGKWKDIATQMLRPAVQSDPKLYNQLQQKKNEAMGAAMAKINQSAQYNALGKQIGTNIQSKPDYHADDAGKMLSTFYKTPMSQLQTASYNGQSTDLTDLENYRYKGGNFDFSKLHGTSAGKPVTHYDDGTTDSTGVQTTQHGYQFGNTPGEYRNVYLGGLAGNEANRAARYKWTSHTQQELDGLDAAYQNSPNWQKLGIQPQQLPAYNPNDPVGNEATYQAKQYLASMNPAEVKAAAITNQGAKMNLQFKHQEALEALKEGDREKLKTLGHQFKQMDQEQQATALNNIYSGLITQTTTDQDGKKKEPHDYFMSADGNVSKEYSMPYSAATAKEFSVPDDKGHPIYPDKILYDQQRKMVTPVFYTPGKPHTLENIDHSLSLPMTETEYKARLGDALLGKKEVTKTFSTPAAPAGTPATKPPDLKPGAFNDLH